MSNRIRFQRASISCIVLSIFSFLYSCRNEAEETGVIPPKVEQPAQPDDLPEKRCEDDVSLGYTDKQSYAPDEDVTAYLQAVKAIQICRLDIYDVQGNVAFSVASSLHLQEIKNPYPSSEGYGFSATVKFALPATLKSGMYLIEKKIPFIVRAKETVDLLIVYPSNTANAYSMSGGKSLYSTENRPSHVSFLRPIELENFSTECLTWFSDQADLKLGYLADIDLDDYDLLKSAKILVIIGHNEYWTRVARQNFDKFVDNGGHALVLSGNNMWWQVRYSDDKNELICYKNIENDPSPNPLLKTILWTSASLDYPILSSLGADFPHGGYGLKNDNGWDGYKIVTPASPLFEGLNLNKGSIIACPTSEYDGSLLTGFDSEGYPMLDKSALNFEKAEILGFDRGFRVNETIGTFIVFQKRKTSGIIVNTGTTDWCSTNGMGGTSGSEIKAITRNAIKKLLAGQTVFAE